MSAGKSARHDSVPNYPFLMRFLTSVALIGLSSAGALPGRAAGTELLNGRDLTGWTLTTAPAAEIGSVCRCQPDGSLAVAGRPIGFLATTASFANYRLHVEWRWSGKPGNGGVLAHISSGPKDRIWPLCFQVQLKSRSAGDVLPMAGAAFAEPLSTPPGAKIPLLNHSAPDNEKPVGEWNACDVVCRDGTIEVAINGVRQNRVTGCAPREGRVGFQLEGTPYELRNVRLSPLEN
jgi:hypothetical protein